MRDDTFLTKEEKKELKRKKEEKRGQMLAYIFGILLFGGYALWSLGVGIYGLFMAEHKPLSELSADEKVYAVYEGDLGEGTDLSKDRKAEFYCNYEHSISGLIPIGHEYYYFIVLDDQKKVISVRANKRWRENLKEYISAGSVPIDGQLRKMAYYDVEKLFRNVVEDNSEWFAGYEIDTEYYLDLTHTSINVLHVIGGIGFLLVLMGSVLFFAADKREKSGMDEREPWIKQSPFPELIMGLFFIMAGLALYLLSVG